MNRSTRNIVLVVSLALTPMAFLFTNMKQANFLPACALCEDFVTRDSRANNVTNVFMRETDNTVFIINDLGNGSYEIKKKNTSAGTYESVKTFQYSYQWATYPVGTFYSAPYKIASEVVTFSLSKHMILLRTLTAQSDSQKYKAIIYDSLTNSISSADNFLHSDEYYQNYTINNSPDYDRLLLVGGGTLPPMTLRIIGDFQPGHLNNTRFLVSYFSYSLWKLLIDHPVAQIRLLANPYIGGSAYGNNFVLTDSSDGRLAIVAPSWDCVAPGSGGIGCDELWLISRSAVLEEPRVQKAFVQGDGFGQPRFIMEPLPGAGIQATNYDRNLMRTASASQVRVKGDTIVVPVNGIIEGATMGVFTLKIPNFPDYYDEQNNYQDPRLTFPNDPVTGTVTANPWTAKILDRNYHSGVIQLGADQLQFFLMNRGYNTSGYQLFKSPDGFNWSGPEDIGLDYNNEGISLNNYGRILFRNRVYPTSDLSVRSSVSGNWSQLPFSSNPAILFKIGTEYFRIKTDSNLNGNFVQSSHLLNNVYGDFNRDGLIDSIDVDALNSYLRNANSTPPTFIAPLETADIDRSGKVGRIDSKVLEHFILHERLGDIPPYSLPLIYGDLNNDTTVNDADLQLLRDYIANPKRLPADFTASVEAADLDIDGKINDLDLEVLIHFQTPPFGMFSLPIAYGDLNLDGIISIADRVLMTAVILNPNAPLPLNFIAPKEAADVNLDGVINNKDRTQLSNLLQGLISSLPNR